MADALYIRIRGQVQGPYTRDKLRSLAKRGRFSRHYEVSADGASWCSAAEHADLFPEPVRRPRRRKRQEDTAAAAPAEAADSNAEAPQEDQAVDDGPLWYYTDGDRECGPVSYADLQYLAKAGMLQPNDLLWTEGLDDWAPASETPELFDQNATDSANQPDEAGASAMAIASLVLGLAGATLLPMIGSILAVVFGHTALSQIAASNGRLGGRGMALAGLILGYIVIIAATIVGTVLLCIYLLRDRLVGG